MVFCGEATVLDVALCIVKGLVVQSLISCVSTAVFGEAAAFMLKLVGIGQDTYGLIEAIKSKDPKEIVIATVRLAVSVFTLKSQCFAGDTLVSTEEGNRRIDEIEPGDKVLSYNTETGENELHEVKNVSVSKTDILVHIITDDGRDIETTMFHPFYVKNEDGTGEWKAASNLKAGDKLLSEDGKKVKVSEVKVEKLAEEITVYNLELDEVHTYYVDDGVLVHNMCATNKNKKENAGGSAGESGASSTFNDAFNAADNYKLDEDTFVKHILVRHGPNSLYSNKSHFASSFDIKSGIDSTLKGENFILKQNTNGRNGYIFEHTYSNPIGTNANGKPLNTLKVVIDDMGNVITAFPKK